MLVALIRPVESRTVDVSGVSGAALDAAVRAVLPAGWDVAQVPARLDQATGGFTATAKMVRRDGVREVDADDMPALVAKVPVGWEMVSARRV